jgi:glycosyltransferase involved in cell wall biosynthesis
VLSQTHGDLELIISDNASDDPTREIGERYAAADPRVNYVRHARNHGPTANFNFLLDSFRGDHVLLLADDDWLELNYVEDCLSELRRSRDHTLVCGLARYFLDGEMVATGAELQLTQQPGEQRVLAYFTQVRDNGTFYGVMSRSAMRRAAPLLNVLGNDWLIVAAMAYQGTIRTLPTTAVNRELGGTSVDTSTIVATFGKPRLQARVPHLFAAWHTLAQLGWRAHVYEDLPMRRRLTLAIRSTRLVINWKSLAWHMTSPTALMLERRPRGRPLARAYFSFTRLLGAGRQKYFRSP